MSENHGKTETREYRIWTNMKTRCLNPANENYSRYGGRGITICQRWMSFSAFLADMGPCPPGMSLEREDNNGEYGKGNCVWANHIRQCNNRRTNLLITFNGKTQTLADWSRESGIKAANLWYRLKSGKSIEEVFSHTPLPRKMTDAGRAKWRASVAKLNPEAVREIRAALARGDKEREIAEAQGVTLSLISSIATGHRWAWVA